MFIESYRIYNIFGVNIPWVFFMVPWHALCAVIYPIVLVGAMYPSQRNVSWLSVRQMWLLGAVVAVIGSVVFFNTERFPAISGGYLVFSWLTIALLVFTAFRVNSMRVFLGETPISPTRRPFVFGSLFSFWMLGAMVIGGVGAHWLVHVAYALFVFWWLYRMFVRNGWFNIRDASRFALGHYVFGALMTIVVSGAHSIVVFGELIVFAVLYFLYRKIKMSERLLESEPFGASAAVV